MCKLIDGPRIPKELKAPVKKRFKKTKTIPEGTEIKYTLIKENSNTKVKELFALYQLDKYKARVKYLNSPDGYTTDRVCIFEFGDKDFEVCVFNNKFGVSITNRIYSSQKKTNSVMFKNGKFYQVMNNPTRGRRRSGVMPLTHFGLLNFIRECEGIGFAYDRTNEKITESKTFQLFASRFPWIKTLHETPAAHALAYNTIKSKSLTGQKDLLRHIFKVPINIANIIIKEVPSMYTNEMNRHYIRASNRAREPFEKLKQWKEISKVLDGVQNITEEFYHHPHFYDTCTMAHKLGRKVNCRWGIKKLEQMHDEWARDLRNILLDCEVEYMLKVRKPFYMLARDTGWKLLFTNKEMLVEGVRQNHCVGGYIDRVERGECAIFHVEGFTLQVGIERVAVVPNKFRTSVRASSNDIPTEVMENMLLNDAKQHMGEGDEKPKLFYVFKNLQFRGHKNIDPPKDLTERVNTILSSYANEDTQAVFEGKVEAEIMNAICDEVHKTKWTVVINHETSKYEIADKGLDGLEVKPPLDINKPKGVANHNIINDTIFGIRKWTLI
jgi:hypothetical protein